MELWGKDSAFCGAVCPIFYTRSGEGVTLPVGFEHAIVQMTTAVCCCGCRPLPPPRAKDDDARPNKRYSQRVRGARGGAFESIDGTGRGRRMADHG